jgi:TonB family protein
MSITWKQLEGQIFDGKFALLRYLGGSERSAVFLTERHDRERLVKAAIKLIPANQEMGELQLLRWLKASELSHPHLIPLYDSGRTEIDGVSLVYVVMECAEENLSQVLPSRALTPAEAREMLESVVNVLSYLHEKGFIHGHIKPANIMASGEQLKVSSDGLCQAGESPDGSSDHDAYEAPENSSGNLRGSQPMSPAGDIWSLGMTIVETLTQKLPVARTAEKQDPLFPKSLQEPFLEIASQCLRFQPQSRWTVGQIAARLESRDPVPQMRTAPTNVPVPLPQNPPIARTSRSNAKRRNYAAPIAIGSALVLAAILAGSRLMHRPSNAPQSSAATVEQPSVPSAPRQAVQPPQEHSSNPYNPAVAEEERSSKTRVAVPALIHPETAHNEERNTAARMPVTAPIRGEVTEQVMPEVLHAARNSIRGTVSVSVRVNVDRSGNVEDAVLESRGPSRYFARAALEAARNWKFKAPMAGGRGVLSTWTLRFKFTRAETTVVPEQELP